MLKTDLNLVIGTTALILLFGLFSSYIVGNSISHAEPFQGSWACTADLRVCPDGSTVSRIPPYCQFAECR